MPKFEWDNNKNRSNKIKHGISFEEATRVFKDKDRIQYINTRKGEKRFVTIGKIIKVIFAVVYTVRKTAIRIISARQAGRREKRDYLENKAKKENGGKK